MKICDHCDGEGETRIEDTMYMCEVCEGHGEIDTCTQEVWIDVDEDTKEYDAEIHIHGKDLFEVLDGISIIRDRINKLNGLN